MKGSFHAFVSCLYLPAAPLKEDPSAPASHPSEEGQGQARPASLGPRGGPAGAELASTPARRQIKEQKKKREEI